MCSLPSFGRASLMLKVAKQHRLSAAIKYLMAKSTLSVTEVLKLLDKDEPDWNDSDVDYNGE